MNTAAKSNTQSVSAAHSSYGPSGPKTVVMLAAYNQTRELPLCLAALDSQTDKAFEVIVADDGSKPPMEELIATLRPQLSIPVSAVWQPDTGYNRASALNLASREALRRGPEFLIVIDSDCIPYRNLIEVYRKRARRGEFYSGGVGVLGVDDSLALDMDAVRRGDHERGLPLSEHWRLFSKQIGDRLAPQGKLQRPRIRGANFAVCAELYRHVDGHDEVFCGFGKEDSDLRNRFRNAGARGVSLWHRAIVTHLSRKTTATAVRRDAPTALYEQGKSLIRARRGMSSGSANSANTNVSANANRNAQQANSAS